MVLVENKILGKLYIGIDISKEIFDICQLNEDGKVLKTFQITSNLEGFNKLLKEIPDSYEPLFAFESTGPFSGNISYFLKSRGLNYINSNAFYVSRLRQAFSASVKNDSIDAFVLAQAARMNTIQHSSKDAKYIYLQDIHERFYDLQDRKTALTNQLHSNLVEVFPGISTIFKDITCNASLAILQNYPSPDLFIQADQKEILKVIRERKGRISIKKLDELHSLCKESVAWKRHPVYYEIIRSQVRELQKIKDEMVSMDNLLNEYLDEIFSKEMRLLKSVPGVGNRTASYTIAVIGDYKRFDEKGDGKGSKRLSSFVGFGLREYSSGSKRKKYGISKRGNSKLRGLLYMAARIAIGNDPAIKVYYEAKKNRKGGKYGFSSVSHLLLRRCYGVLRSGKMYNAAIPAAG